MSIHFLFHMCNKLLRKFEKNISKTTSTSKKRKQQTKKTINKVKEQTRIINIIYTDIF